MKHLSGFLAVILIFSSFCALGSTGASYYVTPGTVTLPTEAQGDGILVGWATDTGEDAVFLAPGASYTATKAVTFEPLFLELSMVAGAAVRTADPAGLRFTSSVGEAGYQVLLETAPAMELGTVILPTDYLSGDFTMEAMDAADKEYLRIPCKVFWSVSESARTYTGVISNIFERNYNRLFSAIPYVSVTYTDHSTEIFYGAYSAEDHSRAAYSVACDALTDPDASYPESAVTVLQNYFHKVGIDVSITVPVEGASPDTAVANTRDARYSVTTDWMCQFSSKMHKVFHNDFGYQATMVVQADAGLTITEDTVLTFNGAPLKKGYTLEDGILTITRRYPLGNYTWAY